MFTIYYNGLFIHGYNDSTLPYHISGADCFRGLEFKSLFAAKLAITKARKLGIKATR